MMSSSWLGLSRDRSVREESWARKLCCERSCREGGLVVVAWSLPPQSLISITTSKCFIELNGPSAKCDDDGCSVSMVMVECVQIQLFEVFIKDHSKEVMPLPKMRGLHLTDGWWGGD